MKNGYNPLESKPQNVAKVKSNGNIAQMDEINEKVTGGVKELLGMLEGEEKVSDSVMALLDELFTDEEGEELLQVEDLRRIGSLLSLSEESFSVISPVILGSFQQEYLASGAAMQVVKYMESNNHTYKDLVEVFDKIIEALDEDDMAEVIPSQAKRDFIKQACIIAMNAIGEATVVNQRTITVPVEICSDSAILPTYAHLGDAAMDLYSPEEVTIGPGEQKIIPLGFKCEIPEGYALLIQGRSGLCAKTKLRIANTPGIIDSSFRGEIGVIVENIDPPIKDVLFKKDDSGFEKTFILYGSSYTIDKGMRFAQMRLVQVPLVGFKKVDKLTETERGAGGFGSSGVM